MIFTVQMDEAHVTDFVSLGTAVWLWLSHLTSGGFGVGDGEWYRARYSVGERKGELAELQTIVLCVNITESILLPERSGARLLN